MTYRGPERRLRDRRTHDVPIEYERRDSLDRRRDPDWEGEVRRIDDMHKIGETRLLWALVITATIAAIAAVLLEIL